MKVGESDDDDVLHDSEELMVIGTHAPIHETHVDTLHTTHTEVPYYFVSSFLRCLFLFSFFCLFSF